MFMLIKRLYIQVFKKEREFIIIFYDGTKSHRSILLLLMFICVLMIIYMYVSFVFRDRIHLLSYYHFM